MELFKSLNRLVEAISFKVVLYTAGIFVVALLIFQAGVATGIRKANFSFQWGDNYHRNFGGPPEGFLQGIPGDEFIGTHGVAGTIIKTENSALIVKGADNVEKVVNYDSTTLVRQGMKDLKVADLKTNDTIVALGAPRDDGTILAKMIRLFSNEERFMLPPPMPRQNNQPFFQRP